MREAPVAPRSDRFDIGDRAAFFDLEGAGRFLVRLAAIRFERAPGAADDAVAAALVGPALGLLLHQRGALPLHGSAVLLQGRACAFLGASGWGKSTMALALARRGAPVLADDLVVTRVRDGRDWVAPAPAGLRLIEAHGPGKRIVTTVRAVDPAPLAALYVLAEGPRPRAVRLAPADALPELVRHGYGPRSFARLDGRAQFKTCAGLAGRVPVYRLERPKVHARLDGVARFVERHAAGA